MEKEKKNIEKQVKEITSLNRLVGDMPHSIEAEQALLGCILLDPEIQGEVVATIKEDDFYVESHKYIYSAMFDIIIKNKPVDFAILSETLEKNGTMEKAGGIEYIMRLSDYMPSTANFKSYFDIVKCDSLLRKLIKGSAEIIEKSKRSQDKGDALAQAEKIIYDISQAEDTGEMIKISSIIPTVMNTFDELSKDKSSLQGIKTGFRGLDALLKGLHRSDMIVLAARPSVGKTSLAMNIVENVAMQGHSCAVFSLEMNKEQLTTRMLCSVADVNMEHAQTGDFDKSEWIKITKAKEKLSKCKIFIDESSMITPQEILSKCRRIKSKVGLDLIMIDYIQLMDIPGGKEDNRAAKVQEISRNIKIIAKELNVPVLVLSQISRLVERENRRPQMSDLRESGAIEQDADIIMFIHRPDKDKNLKDKDFEEGKVRKNIAQIIVEKNRNGSQGMVELYFKGECTRFINLNENKEPEGEEATFKNQQAKPSNLEQTTKTEQEESNTESKDSDDVDDIF